MQPCRIDVDSPGSAGVTGREVAVQPGDQITFGGWVYLESGGGGDLGWWIIVMDATQSTITYVATPNPTSAGWTFQSATYTVPSNGAYVQLYGQIWLPSSSTVLRVDDGFLYDDRLSLTVTDNLDYLPFGEQISGSSVTSHKFTSDERDSETNLDHTLFRQYSSSLGLWTTPDPAGLAAAAFGNPQSLNQYAYVLDDPVDLIDPLGLCGSAVSVQIGPIHYAPSFDYSDCLEGGSASWGIVLPCAGFLNAGGTAPCPLPGPPPSSNQLCTVSIFNPSCKPVRRPTCPEVFASAAIEGAEIIPTTPGGQGPENAATTIAAGAAAKHVMERGLLGPIASGVVRRSSIVRTILGLGEVTSEAAVFAPILLSEWYGIKSEWKAWRAGTCRTIWSH